MNNLIKSTGTELEQEITELIGNSFGPLLKFDANTSNFSIGEHKVAIGREYVAHVDQYARGFTKFVNKRPVSVKVKKISEGLPEKREQLDDLDLADQDNDPWVFQRYLPLEDVETGEIAVFITKSVGGKIALGNLLLAYNMGRHRGLPIVKLGIGSFRSEDYGKKARPAFAIIRWVGDNDAGVQEGGPPETDPEDPGYDILTRSR
jgi:hypothetical protein